MFALRIASRVAREVAASPKDLQGALLEAIENLTQDPRPLGAKKLSGTLAGSWRIRVRSWRVIYDIYDKERVVLIAAVGPRKSIYR